MTTNTTKTKLTGLALATAIFTAATLLAGGSASAKPAQAFRASMHNSESAAANKETFARAAAPVTLQHVHVTPPLHRALVGTSAPESAPRPIPMPEPFPKPGDLL
jgi:hypothetical protein